MPSHILDIRKSILIGHRGVGPIRLQFSSDCSTGSLKSLGSQRIVDGNGVCDSEIQCEVFHISGVILKLEL
jgi:hypothetical protein